MDKIKLTAICILASSFALSGCVARTYNLTRDRVDQELSVTSGNRGYIMGQPPAESGDRKTTRTIKVFEFELGPSNKTKTSCPAVTPLATSANEPKMVEETAPVEVFEETAVVTSVETTAPATEKYTVAKNDTLQKISMKFYGTTRKWMKIYEANKNTLKGPDKVYPGQVLEIPSAGKITETRSSEIIQTEENLK
ncbi:MAG: LysM peptidoglycan-binding domain-containing protein [Candidatus Omnitrophica bacterium]|jgi:LysM repeat protein|nr:LysM peptidoglycan-binding domain-containing protein [Candidatus Omnitrophota bacterium]MDD5725335.1 LysM peptidoglycan-binding domain-containing protein [Candidatus Omnitrophota bacterium]